MSKPRTLRAAADYRPALLWLMGQLERTTTSEALAEFERLLGDLIPPAHRTDISDKQLAQRARRILREVHAFLNGDGGAVSSEKAYNWMQFCYALGLYRETAVLFAYVFQGDLPEWAYQRARKMAEACRARLE